MAVGRFSDILRAANGDLRLSTAVSVYVHGQYPLLAVIYRDPDGTVSADNPTYSSSDTAEIGFYADPGLYDFRIGGELIAEQVPIMDSAGSFGTFIPTSIVDFRGDLIVGIADDNPVRVGVGADGTVLTADSSQAEGVRWSTAAGGDVTGPASSTDNAVTRFDGVSGKLVQNSTVTVSDTGTVRMAAQSAPLSAAGQLFYDTSLRTLVFDNDDANVRLPIGRQTWLQVFNGTGVTLVRGKAVYVSDHQESAPFLPIIAYAKADDQDTARAIGLVLDDIAPLSVGFVLLDGILDLVNTTGLNEGEYAYVSAVTAGELTFFPPSEPNFSTVIGIADAVSGTHGSILVFPNASTIGLGSVNHLRGMNATASAEEYKHLQGTAGRLTVNFTPGFITLDVDNTVLNTKLDKTANLSDLNNPATARTNLGLGTAATTNTGTGPTNTILGNDTRLTDARTPTAHAATHASAGTDPVTLAQSQITNLTTDLAAKQPLDSDLTAIAALTPANDDLVQRKAGAWTNRTPAQFKTDLALTKSDVGLGNVDNTSDANKPISTATQAALDAKQPLDSDLTAIAGLTPSNDDIVQRKAGAWTNRTPAQFKTDLALTKSDVGLGNVDNTSDANKPISTATQAALDAKVTGPASATDEAVARYDSTTGKLVQNSTVTINDGGSVTLPNQAGAGIQTAGSLVYRSPYLEFTNNESEVILLTGSQTRILVRNSTGSTITREQFVYVNGFFSITGPPTVALARADAESTSRSLGFALHDIENGTNGWILLKGTFDFAALGGLTVGAPVYLSETTAGAFTGTKPSAPNLSVVLGVVSRTSGGAVTLIVRPQEPQPGAATNGYFLTSRSASGVGQFAVPPPTWCYPTQQGGFFYAGGPHLSRMNTTPTLNLMHLVPFQIMQDDVLTTANLEVTANAGGALVRGGIYSVGSDLKPLGAAIADYGTISAASTGTITFSVSTALASGLYYFAVVGQSVAPTLRFTTGFSPFVSDNAFQTGATVGIDNCFTQAGVSGALPSASVGGQAAAPLIGLQFA